VAAVSVYLDASALVSLFISDPHTAQADRFLRGSRETIVVSDFAAAEFASGVSQHVRSRRITPIHARGAFLEFDEWTARAVEHIQTTSQDMTAAGDLLRRLDTSLRTPDALHVVMARRIGAQLLTFDRTMASAARSLGITVLKA
jgi:predicted nucleic acid-binding protein